MTRRYARPNTVKPPIARPCSRRRKRGVCMMCSRPPPCRRPRTRATTSCSRVGREDRALWLGPDAASRPHGSGWLAADQRNAPSLQSTTVNCIASALQSSGSWPMCCVDSLKRVSLDYLILLPDAIVQLGFLIGSPSCSSRCIAPSLLALLPALRPARSESHSDSATLHRSTPIHLLLISIPGVSPAVRIPPARPHRVGTRDRPLCTTDYDFPSRLHGWSDICASDALPKRSGIMHQQCVSSRLLVTPPQKPDRAFPRLRDPGFCPRHVVRRLSMPRQPPVTRT